MGGRWSLSADHARHRLPEAGQREIDWVGLIPISLCTSVAIRGFCMTVAEFSWWFLWSFASSRTNEVNYIIYAGA